MILLKVVHFYFFVTCLLVRLSFVDVPTLWMFLFAESLVSIYIKWNIPFYQDDPPAWDRNFLFRRMFPWDGIEIVLYKFYNRFYKMATTKKKQPEKLRKIHLKIFLPEKNTIFTSQLTLTLCFVLPFHDYGGFLLFRYQIQH